MNIYICLHNLYNDCITIYECYYCLVFKGLKYALRRAVNKPNEYEEGLIPARLFKLVDQINEHEWINERIL